MAVAVVEDDNARRIVLVAISEPRGYLRPGVIMAEDEVLVPGLGHAEQDIVDHVAANGWRLIDIGATRPICPRCADAIRAAGGHISTSVRL
jgi:filamentous hemagglutinin